MNATAPAGAADSPPFSTPLAVALAAGAAVPAALRMRTSLWLDETITYWAVADGGFLDAIEKTLRNPPQSVLYTPFVWAAVQLGGPSEAVLRIPSFIATALAAYLIYRLGTCLVDRETGALAAIGFAYWYGPMLASNARQYALAMLTVVASTLIFVRWLKGRRTRDAATYALVFSACLYLQPLYGPLVLIHLLVAWARGQWRWRSLIALYVCVTVLLLPLAWHFSVLRSRASILTFTRVASWADAAPLLVICGLLGLALAVSRQRLPEPLIAWPLIAWTVAPLAVIVGLGQAAGLGIVTWRYFAYMAPGVVLTIATVLRTFSPFKRYSLLAAWITVSLVTMNVRPVENWRDAAAEVRALEPVADTPVLVRTGIPEARQWYRLPERAPYLLTPLAYYPIPGRLIPLPYTLDWQATHYLEREVVPFIRSATRIVILAHDWDLSEDTRVPFKRWFDQHLNEFVSRETWRDNNLTVIVYDRR